MADKIQKTDDEWKRELPPDVYRIAREKGTEMAFTGEYNKNKAAGIYTCICCGAKLFASETKYDSGSGWPSFYKPLQVDAVEEHVDRSHGMVRREVVCAKCDAHLGHVFDDGPDPTGLRYCMNSRSLKFQPKTE
ncbi:MAG TPA: peptide-methionine (R)-S-oxide reductase MsrB [Spirochaetia bacterium]|nr:peptide-methionine (R)-S-oxide reductase MsrB [Spirochaetia bacterium]